MQLGRGLLVVAVAGVAAAAGCGDRGSGEKTVVIAAGGDADHIVPLMFTAAPGQVYTELMFEKLADIGPGQVTVGDAGYEPRLAKSWRWSSDSLQITFALDPKARWHDGKPVRAGDLRFAFGIYVDPKVVANGGSDLARNIDSISIGDSLTATVWFKRREPEQFHAVAYNLIPLPEHLLGSTQRDSIRVSAFARAPVGNGPFKFVAWEKGRRMELAAFDSFSRGRPKLDRVIFTMPGDAGAAARAVIAGDADFIESAQPDDVLEATKHAEVRTTPVRGYEYGFLSFNLRTPDGKGPHPVFGSRELRRALTMAVDRAPLVKNVYDTLARVGVGPYSSSAWTADSTITQLPYDVAAAERTLDSLGYVRGADGMRSKGGKPLTMTILVSSSNRARGRLAELVQQSFAKVGVKVTVDGVDFAGFRAKLGTHTFDGALFTWRTSPSPVGIRNTWTSVGYGPGLLTNAGGYRNPVFEAHIDSGLASRSMHEARAHFRVAYTQAVEDPPAIWLFEPLVVSISNRRLVTGPMRRDAWWQSVASWDVTGPPRRSTGTAPNP